MGRLLSLDDPRALAPGVVGAKAAGLARAMAAGLPVLPGWVVPASAGASAIAEGASVLARGGSAAAACLAINGLDLDPKLLDAARDALAVAGGRGIVRSSSDVEADPRWSGAFATYLDVGAEDMATGIRGCWASVFTRDVLERADEEGIEPASIEMSVLLQPWVSFEAGGTASVAAEGDVVVTSAAGPPADLVSGRIEGVTTRIDPGGSLGDPLLEAVVRLVRHVVATTGDDAIEWGARAGEVVVLQARRAAPPALRVVASPTSITFPPRAIRVADLATAYPGPLGETLVLPWAVALEGSLHPAPSALSGDPARDLEEARETAATLIAEAWGLPGDEALAAAAAAFRELRGTDPVAALAGLPVAPVDPERAASVLGTIEAIGRSLAADRRLPRAASVWRVGVDELSRALSRGTRPVLRHGPDRWEPFVAEVVGASGARHAGEVASGGVGAGRLHLLTGPTEERPDPRAVLWVPAPAPAVAPLLWGCAGLVTAGGSIGAHLFEVARSLGVPAVVGVDLPASGARDGELVAVDGDAGIVSVLAHGEPDLQRRGA
ncbi:MAG TPA: PEP/pyruvate-binding domain-containing protein [Actinomycetota bacterium]